VDDQALRELLHRAGYIADEGLATTLWLAAELQRPLLIEGDAGVGKTALAIALAHAQGRVLVRLQCHEGLDLAQAAYEWNYGRQLLAIRLHETQGDRMQESDLFAREYLLERPLLQAIASPAPCVLLIDEIDRADEAFEAFLLEVLADYQITVPELGTLTARHVPQVLLTSNGTRELSDALRRRCLYHWLDYPTLAREIAIVRATLPQAEGALVEQAVGFVQRLRREDLGKTPGVAETLDWVRVLFKLGLTELPVDPAQLAPSLAALLKTRNDRWALTPERVGKLIDGPRIGQDVGVAGGMK
jgi:MoxR-like ATPase